MPTRLGVVSRMARGELADCSPLHRGQIFSRQEEHSGLRHEVAPRPGSKVQLASPYFDAKGLGGRLDPCGYGSVSMRLGVARTPKWIRADTAASAEGYELARRGSVGLTLGFGASLAPRSVSAKSRRIDMSLRRLGGVKGQKSKFLSLRASRRACAFQN